MAVYYENIMKVDMDQGNIRRTFLNNVLAKDDNAANRFGVEIFRNGTAADLSGNSCVAYFIRPDGYTVVIEGSVSGNRAMVELPAACYFADGNFMLSIKLTNEDKTTTIRVIDGTVINTQLGDIVDPGGVIPDISEFEALIEREEAASEVIEELSITNTLITGTRYRINVSFNEE